MKCIITILLVLFSIKSYSNEYSTAISFIEKAVLNHKDIKPKINHLEKTTQKLLLKITGLSDGDLIYVSWIVPMASGEINTKEIKSFKTEIFGGTLTPVVEYRFTKSQYFSSIVTYHYEF